MQERVPDGIKKALVNNYNINIGAIRKPARKVVRAEAESNLCTSDDHNVLLIDAQRPRNVCSEVGQRIRLRTESIRIS